MTTSDSCVLVRRLHHCVVHTIRSFRGSWPCELQVSAYYNSVYALPLFHFGLGLELFLFDFDFDFHSLGAWEVRLCSLTLEPSSRPFIFALGPSVARLFSTEVSLSFRASLVTLRGLSRLLLLRPGIKGLRPRGDFFCQTHPSHPGSVGVPGSSGLSDLGLV